MARSSRPPAEVAKDIRAALLAIDPNIGPYSSAPLPEMFAIVYVPMKAAVIALGAFGVLALMLSVTGIYGLSAYAVSRRSREIAVRMAIGARPGQVLQSVFGRLGVLVAAGATLGLAAGLAGAKLLGAIVYQASPRDPAVILGVVITISVFALGAAFGPARRAITLDPLKSLRQD